MSIRRTYEGDISAAERVSHEADMCVRKTQAIKDQLGISYINKSYALAGGEQVYVVITQNASYVHTITAEKHEYYEGRRSHGTMAFIEFGVPDYVSCAVLAPIIDESEKEVYVGTFVDRFGLVEDKYATIRRDALRRIKFADYASDRQPMQTALEKLAVLPAPGHEPIVGPYDTNKYAQYKTVRAGLYTGYLKTVVQLMLGIGKVVIVDATEYGRVVEEDTYEKRWARANDKKLDFVEYALDGVTEPPFVDEFPYKLYGQKPAQTVEVKVPFHYGYSRTHGIGWASGSGQAFIIELGQRGAYAMPFPIDPYSQTEKGRARYLELFPELEEEDENGKSIFNSLGGFPAVEMVPTSTAMLQAYVRAGEAVEFLTSEKMRDVYENSGYSSCLGWAFNPVGNRADITCYGYPDGKLHAVGYHFAVTYALVYTGEPKKPAGGETLSASLGLKGFETRKALRMTDEQVEDILAIEDLDARYEAFDNAVVAAPFRVSGSLKRIKRGNLYHPGRLVPMACHQFSGQPQFKIPEPMMGCLVSFDFGSWERLPEDKRPKCDTPIFVMYKGNGELNVLNYFYDPKPLKPGEPESTRDRCQYTGTWTYFAPKQQPYVSGHFYSTQWDPRKEITGGQSKTDYEGEFLGFTQFVPMSCSAWWYHSICYTEVWGAITHHTETAGGHSMSISTAVPMGERSIYYMMTFEQKTGCTQSDGYSGTQYWGWGGEYNLNVSVYNWYIHWYPCRIEPNWGLPLQCRLHEYADPTPAPEGACFAGNTPNPTVPQYEVCAADGSISFGWRDLKPGTVFKLSFRDGNIPIARGWNTSTKPTAMVEYKVRIFGDTEIDGLYTYNDRMEGEDPAPEYEGQLVNFYSTPMSPWWFKPSPDNCDNRAYMLCNINHWGSNAITYEPQIDALETKFYGSPEDMHVYNRAVYTGYIR